MKQYKHKQTGYTITKDSNKPFYVSEKYGNVHPELIENSNDWQEIVELCVPYGTKFKNNHTNVICMIMKHDDIKCMVISTRDQSLVNLYLIENVNSFFKKGTWKVYEEIPEYVKCVKLWCGLKKSTVGKIYKTSEKPEFSVHAWEIIYSAKYSFIPATKEEYDAQERETIMQECIKRFPKGSKVRCAQDGKIYTIAQSYKYGDSAHVQEVYYYGATFFINYINILAISTEKNSIGFYLCYNGEYAELVKELDYEILSFVVNNNRTNTKGNIYTKKENGNFEVVLTPNSNQPIGDYSIDQFLDSDCYNIHSVKRLSDGEVFTVGDKVTHKNGVCKGNIKSFYTTSKNEIALHIENANIFLENWVKLKQPLFTTEDGVDIFEDTNFIWIAINNENYSWKINEVNSSTKFYFGNVHKLFSTKEAAEEYIIMNKPCLAINDLKNIKEENGCFADGLIGYATEIVKQKLKN